ncbi:MAG: biopolymer transporter ExbD [Planctomycetes bacterium]|nr:biopolymer transporter ExbD [Planctomycetota bacterium]
MIDIVFNLVIFFMLMPSSQGDFLPTNLPSGLGPGGSPDVRGLRLQLRHVEPWPERRHEAEIVFCGEVLPDYGALRNRLRETRQTLSGMAILVGEPLVIEPDQAVEHRHVVAAFDAAVDAGFKNIRFSVPK